ncbi:hypothetical protein DFS33DRAFT_203653 [Desarmillaria ectypa]|nr:hypothetical protein DFS33DRAFT_203653 [Desarmillaria ectypa]
MNATRACAWVKGPASLQQSDEMVYRRSVLVRIVKLGLSLNLTGICIPLYVLISVLDESYSTCLSSYFLRDKCCTPFEATSFLPGSVVIQFILAPSHCFQLISGAPGVPPYVLLIGVMSGVLIYCISNHFSSSSHDRLQRYIVETSITVSKINPD